MTQYIDKDALVAELKKRISDYWSDSENTMGIYPYALEEVIKYADTLEVKEVDLKKEFSQWWKGERAKDYNVDILYERYPNVSMKLARHFFELGLNAQKRE